VQKAFALGSGLITGGGPDQEVIVEHVPQPLQRPARRRLAEQQPRRGARDVSFFRKHREDDQQVQVSLT
jgi:hypothetical protein